MQTKSVKVGWVIMLIVGVQRIFAGIMLAATGQKDLDVGILFVLNAVAIIGITLGSYRKAEKWSWWCLLIIGLTPPLYCLIAHGINAWNIVGLVLFIPAIVIPAVAILGKKTA
jgi:hypothetical protein